MSQAQGKDPSGTVLVSAKWVLGCFQGTVGDGSSRSLEISCRQQQVVQQPVSWRPALPPPAPLAIAGAQARSLLGPLIVLLRFSLCILFFLHLALRAQKVPRKWRESREVGVMFNNSLTIPRFSSTVFQKFYSFRSRDLSQDLDIK